MNKNQIRESKIPIDNKIDEVYTNIKILDESMRDLESNQKAIKSTERKINNNTTKNTLNTKNASTQTETPPTNKQPIETDTPKSSPKNTRKPSPMQAQNTSEEISEGKKHIYVIMDSNRKFINFKELLEIKGTITNPIVIPCGNIKKAKEFLESNKIRNPHKIIIHLGVNDIDIPDSNDIAFQLKTLGEAYQLKYNCDVLLSEIIPRGDHLNNQVIKINRELQYHLANSVVQKISHNNLNPSHLYDDRHLRRNKVDGEALSGVQVLAQNIFEAVVYNGQPMDEIKMQKILRNTNKSTYRYQYYPQKAEYHNSYRDSNRNPQYRYKQQTSFPDMTPHKQQDINSYWQKNNFQQQIENNRFYYMNRSNDYDDRTFYNKWESLV